jgi:hypothetical protein
MTQNAITLHALNGLQASIIFHCSWQKVKINVSKNVILQQNIRRLENIIWISSFIFICLHNKCMYKIKLYKICLAKIWFVLTRLFDDWFISRCTNLNIGLLEPEPALRSVWAVGDFVVGHKGVVPAASLEATAARVTRLVCRRPLHFAAKKTTTHISSENALFMRIFARCSRVGVCCANRTRLHYRRRG